MTPKILKAVLVFPTVVVIGRPEVLRFCKHLVAVVAPSSLPLHPTFPWVLAVASDELRRMRRRRRRTR